MPLGTAAELDFMLKDAGVAVTYGAQSTYGLLNKSVQKIQSSGTDFEISDGSETVQIRDGSLNTLQADAAIMVGGSNYVIRDIGQPSTDGLRTITLEENAP